MNAAPRPRLRGEANREDVLRRVIAAVERLLAAGQPFSEVTIEQIAREAGIARSTFYAHFRDRSALLRQIAAVVLEDLQDIATSLLELGAGVTLADVRAIMGALIEAFRPHEPLIGPILAAAAEDPEVHVAYELGIARAAAVAEAFIIQQRRLLPLRDLPPREAATALTRMVERTITLEAAGASAERRERIGDTLARIVWHALFSDA